MLIELTCDGTNYSMCECTKARARQRHSERNRERAASNRAEREAHWGGEWEDKPMPCLRKVEMPP